jgi:hypothetical protein
VAAPGGYLRWTPGRSDVADSFHTGAGGVLGSKSLVSRTGVGGGGGFLWGRDWGAFRGRSHVARVVAL